MEKCSVCGEEFETEEGLLKHNRETHAGVEGSDEQEDPDSKTESRS